MGLSILVFTQLFSKSTQKKSRVRKKKQNLTWSAIQGQAWSSSLGKLGSVGSRRELHNNVGLISHPIPSPGNPREYPHKPYITRNYSHWTTSSLVTVWVYLRSNFRGGLRKTLSWSRVGNGSSGSSKIVDFGINRNRVGNFLLAINRTLVLSCPVSEILQVFC